MVNIFKVLFLYLINNFLHFTITILLIFNFNYFNLHNKYILYTMILYTSMIVKIDCAQNCHIQPLSACFQLNSVPCLNSMHPFLSGLHSQIFS